MSEEKRKKEGTGKREEDVGSGSLKQNNVRLDRPLLPPSSILGKSNQQVRRRPM
ncbi:hypothetical protein SESBI_38805 [Sesbania bispinosa]|nr:hypothetical protein SESBI_38805 [Sesbania bispinosa]